MAPPDVVKRTHFCNCLPGPIWKAYREWLWINNWKEEIFGDFNDWACADRDALTPFPIEFADLFDSWIFWETITIIWCLFHGFGLDPVQSCWDI
jgi:hypothetical protein